MANRLTNLFLERRGYTGKYLEDANNGAHQKLKNIDKLCEILNEVHKNHDRIVIMPDFDTDGISAGTMFAGFCELGFNAGLYPPNSARGYGIHVQDIKDLIKMDPQVKYIITCDVGITCYDAFEYAYQQGLKVLVTDHHEEQENKPKPLRCEVAVDPCLLDETYKQRDICGAFVLWQVLDEYARTYMDSFAQEQIQRLRVFAGIGTVGDMMSIVHENRVLLKDTVTLLRLIYNNGDDSVVKMIPGCFVYKRAFYGLFILLKSFAKNGQLRSSNDLDEKFIGWTIAPTYNSAKRLEMRMNHVFGIFFGQTPEVQQECAELLIQKNDERKVLVADDKLKLDQEYGENLQPYAPFIYLTDAPGGVLGLLANQYEQENQLPTFVINKKTLNGSGRSFSYFPVISALSGTEFSVAGHQEAFGIGFKNMAQVARFYDYLVANVLPLAQHAIRNVKDDCDLTLALNSDVNHKYDYLLNIDEASDFHRDTTNLKPFGAGFPEPKIRISFKSSDARFLTMGSKQNHLKIILPNSLQLIAWKKASMKDKLENEDTVSFNGDFSFNHFRGQTTLQMIGDPESRSVSWSESDFKR